jgi:hypothetical protein
VLADNCPENYRCFWLLLSGEMKRVQAQPVEAETSCKAAIAYARETDNLQQEALASELCARACLAHSGESAAVPFWIEARRCYAAWGAVVKVQQMDRKYGHLLATRPTLAIQERPPSHESATGAEEASLDIATVLSAGHAIAVEMEIDALLRKLMRIALLNAGAQRGFFLREREGRLLVEIGPVGGPRSPARKCPGLARAVVVRPPRRSVSSATPGLTSFGEDRIASAHRAPFSAFPPARKARASCTLRTTSHPTRSPSTGSCSVLSQAAISPNARSTRR